MLTADGAHDAGGHGVGERAQRAADGDGVLADLECARVAHLHGGQVRALDLDDGQVREGVEADDLTVVALPVRELHRERVRVADHVRLVMTHPSGS